jgi:hypothetical protein
MIGEKTLAAHGNPLGRPQQMLGIDEIFDLHTGSPASAGAVACVGDELDQLAGMR